MRRIGSFAGGREGTFAFEDGKRHLSISRIFVSTLDSVVNGQRNWGIPKDVAQFDVRYGDNGVDRVTVSRNGSLTLGATFANLGNAPTYEPWTVAVELVNAQGLVRWRAPLPVTLGDLPGGGATQVMPMQSFQLPKKLPIETFFLRIVARDPRQATNPLYHRPMLKWVSSQRDADGGLTIATLRRR